MRATDIKIRKSQRRRLLRRSPGFGQCSTCWCPAAFLGVIIYMNLLPVKYLCIGGGAVALLLLLLFPALFFRNF